MNNPRDPNNNSGKRKVHEHDPFRDMRTPAPALRNNRRYSIAPGALGPGPLLAPRPHPHGPHPHHQLGLPSAAAAVPAAAAASRQVEDDDRRDHAYQNYIAALGWKLALKRAKERVQKDVDDQLSHLQRLQSQQEEEMNDLSDKLSVQELCVSQSHRLNVLHEDIAPTLRDQIVSKQDQFQSLGANVKNTVNSLPTKCVQPVTVGHTLDALVSSSEGFQRTLCQGSFILESKEVILRSENELQMFSETKSTLPTFYESVSQLRNEVGGNILHLQQELPVDFSNKIE